MKRNDYFSLVYIVYTALRYIYSDLFFAMELCHDGKSNYQISHTGIFLVCIYNTFKKLINLDCEERKFIWRHSIISSNNCIKAIHNGGNLKEDLRSLVIVVSDGIIDISLKAFKKFLILVEQGERNKLGTGIFLFCLVNYFNFLTNKKNPSECTILSISYSILWIPTFSLIYLWIWLILCSIHNIEFSTFFIGWLGFDWFIITISHICNWRSNFWGTWVYFEPWEVQEHGCVYVNK